MIENVGKVYNKSNGLLARLKQMTEGIKWLSRLLQKRPGYLDKILTMSGFDIPLE